MAKTTYNVRELIDKFQENCDRISAIADLCERDQRERTEAETKEFESLTRENQVLQMRMQAATAQYLAKNPNAVQDATALLRENVKRGQQTQIVFMRDIMVVSDVSGGGIIPLNIMEILKPLEEGFILDKVGLPLPTGLVGDFVWPMYEAVEASIAGEGVALTDTKISWNKLTATPQRIGIAIPVTNQALNATDGILETVVREVMPQALRTLLNKIMFSTTAVTGAVGLKGPFVGLASSAVQLSATPTFDELNRLMKAAILETGVDGEHMAWVMTKSMAATLEGTPINSNGIFVPMLQNGILCGMPVYTSNAIRKVTGSGSSKTVTEYIGLGDWRYQPLGLFNTLRFVVDPYSKARNDSVDFVLNADFATKTLRPEAFKLGQVAAS